MADRPDPRQTNPRYAALRAAAAKQAAASQAADKLAERLSGDSVNADKYRNHPLRRELMEACGNDERQAAKLYDEAMRKAGAGGGVRSKVMKALFNR